MYDDIIELGKSYIIMDEKGNQHKEYIFKEFFAEVKSVKQSEFYIAAQSGFKPEYKFVLSDYYDYDEHEVVRYNNNLYDIIRTYRISIGIEIIAQRKIEGVASIG